MAPRGGPFSLRRPASDLVLRLNAGYFVLFFLFTLSLIIRKSLELSFPTHALAQDLALLFLLALLQLSLYFCGVKGSLTDSGPLSVSHLVLCGGSLVLAVYFLWWQTYVLWADLLLSSVLLLLLLLSALLGCGTIKYSHYFT